MYPEIELIAIGAIAHWYAALDEMGDSRNSARNASVAIIERVDGDEPEMGDGGPQHRIGVVLGFEPIEKRFHFARKLCGGRRLVVDALFADHP